MVVKDNIYFDNVLHKTDGTSAHSTKTKHVSNGAMKDRPYQKPVS